MKREYQAHLDGIKLKKKKTRDCGKGGHSPGEKNMGKKHNTGV